MIWKITFTFARQRLRIATHACWQRNSERWQPSGMEGRDMLRCGRILGIVAQALVMGTLLFVAVFRLAGILGGARVFQYEGF